VRLEVVLNFVVGLVYLRKISDMSGLVQLSFVGLYVRIEDRDVIYIKNPGY